MAKSRVEVYLIGNVVENGTLKIPDAHKKRFRENIREAFQGKTVEVVVREVLNTRSAQQNRYYWGVIIPYLRDCLQNSGYSTIKNQDVHEFLKSKYATKELVNADTGEVTEIPISTKEMTLDDFSVYIESIREFCIDTFGAPFPDANEQVRNTV